MALHWDFRYKAGTVTQVQNGHEFTANFYEGNSLMIVLYEYEKDGENLYDLLWFFMDEAHAKNCLGLSKGHDNMFDADAITNLTIYRDHCRQWLTLVKLFTKAFPHIAIDIRDTAPGEEGVQ